MSDDVQVVFGANIDGAVEGIDTVGHKLKDLEGPAREIAESFGQLRKTFIEAFAVDEIAEFVSHIAELGEQAVRNSAMLGMSVESVQRLGFAARMTGGDADSMAMGLMRLERNMAEAQSGSGKAYEAFQSLGISLNDLKTKSPEQILNKIADAFKGSQDGADKTAIAMDLMGRSGARMIPLLDQGAEGLRQMGETADKTGSILQTLEAHGLEGTAQKITTLKASFEGAGISLLEVFKPAIDALIDGLTSLVQVFTAVIETIRVIVDLIEGGLAVALTATIEKFEEFGLKVANVFNDIKIKITEVSSVLDELAHGHLQAAVDAQRIGEAEIAQSNANTAKQIQVLGAEYESLKTKIEDATQAALTFGNAESKEAKSQLHAPTAGGAGTEDNSDEQIALDQIKTEEQLAKIGLQTQKDVLEQEVAAHKISKAEEYATLQDYLGLEYQVESEALDKKLELYGEDEVKYKQTLDQKEILDAQYQQQLAKLAAQGAQAQAEASKKNEQTFKATTDLISRDMDSMLQGILQGTQTWQQAMDKLFSNLATSFIEAVLKMMVQWAAFEVLTEGFNIGGLTNPLSGGIGGIAASALGIKSYDVGSWSVPNDQLAFIHQNEMIVPASQASAIRSGSASLGGTGDSGGSAGNFTININAIDTQSGAQFLKNNAAVIASTISGQVRNFNRNLQT